MTNLLSQVRHCDNALGRDWASPGSACGSAGELLCDSDILIFINATVKLLKMHVCRDKAEILVCYLCLHSWLYNLQLYNKALWSLQGKGCLPCCLCRGWHAEFGSPLHRLSVMQVETNAAAVKALLFGTISATSLRQQSNLALSPFAASTASLFNYMCSLLCCFTQRLLKYDP